MKDILRHSQLYYTYKLMNKYFIIQVFKTLTKFSQILTTKNMGSNDCYFFSSLSKTGSIAINQLLRQYCGLTLGVL
jgi:hypothetical protein